jgi:solute carrier family 25, member 34/35
MNGVRLGVFPYWNRALMSLFQVDPAGHESHSASESARVVAARLLSGMGAGIVGAFVGHPMYLVKNRLQTISHSVSGQGFAARTQYNYKGTLDGLARIYREEGGVRALFRGWDAAAFRIGAGSAAQLASYETLKDLVARTTGLEGMKLHVASSAGASVFVTMCMTPFDVVSTRYMQSRSGSSLYSSPLDCFVKTARAEGVFGLWRGAGALYLRLAPHTILTLTFLEQFRSMLGLL